MYPSLLSVNWDATKLVIVCMFPWHVSVFDTHKRAMILGVSKTNYASGSVETYPVLSAFIINSEAQHDISLSWGIKYFF